MQHFRLATWHLQDGQVGPPARWAAASNVEGGSGTEEEALQPGGPVCPPARWAAASNVEGGSGTEEGAHGPQLGREGSARINYLQGSPEFLVTPLLMGPVCPLKSLVISVSEFCFLV